ncbi:hypothetical protein Hypma_005687 [Hypsizygus marmoreus]|uniref:Uncharacterized protein n=1 Tax=Hypsizygus marmoreus TaxID=39966 RepID=A0A369K6L7_HYPMA|nr:hypothetical protein Hypma_005687 [Hypsizygus marmoreus]
MTIHVAEFQPPPRAFQFSSPSIPMLPECHVDHNAHHSHATIAWKEKKHNHKQHLSWSEITPGSGTEAFDLYRIYSSIPWSQPCKQITGTSSSSSPHVPAIIPLTKKLYAAALTVTPPHASVK